MIAPTSAGASQKSMWPASMPISVRRAPRSRRSPSRSSRRDEVGTVRGDEGHLARVSGERGRDPRHLAPRGHGGGPREAEPHAAVGATARGRWRGPRRRCRGHAAGRRASRAAAGLLHRGPSLVAPRLLGLRAGPPAAGSATAGSSSTTPRTRSGARAARCSARRPPKEWPATTARPTPSASSVAIRSSTCCSMPHGGSHVECPCPRRSGASTRTPGSSASASRR